MKVTIWDTAGQDRFKVLTRGYYRGCHGAMIGTLAPIRASLSINFESQTNFF